MKSPVLLLVGSLAANAVLVGALVTRGPGRGSDDTASSRSVLSSASATTPGNGIDGAPAASSAPPGAAASASFDPSEPILPARIWSALQAGDLETYIANLRAAGFPDKTVRTLASVALSERHEQRRKELESTFEATPYWRERIWWSHAPTSQAIREIWREHNETLKQLFGPDAIEESGQTRMWRERQYGSIPREKVDEINRIQQDYSELSQEIQRAADGFQLPEDRQKLAFLEKEKLADVQAILTPEEFLEYQLRNSRSTNQLRNEFRHLELSEQEFRALYALRAPFAEQFDTPFDGPRDPQQAKARAEAEKQLREQYRTVLDEARYEEYLRLRDYDYQRLHRISQRLELPTGTAVRIHDLKTSTEQRANEIRRNSGLKPEERNAQLTALAAQVKGAVSSALGARGYDAYVEQGGHWLRNLEPPPPPKPAPASASGAASAKR